VDPRAALSPGEAAVLETKILVARGSLADVFATAMRQRDSRRREASTQLAHPSAAP